MENKIKNISKNLSIASGHTEKSKLISFDLITTSFENKLAMPVSHLSYYGDYKYDFSYEHPSLVPTVFSFDYELNNSENLIDPQNWRLFECLADSLLSWIYFPVETYSRKINTKIQRARSSWRPLIKFMHKYHIQRFKDINPSDIDRYLQKTIEKGINKYGKKPPINWLTAQVQGLPSLYYQSKEMNNGLKFNPMTNNYENPKKWAKHHGSKQLAKGKAPKIDEVDARRLVKVCQSLMGQSNKVFKLQEDYNLHKNKYNSYKKYNWSKLGKELGIENGYKFSKKISDIVMACSSIILLFSGMRYWELAHLNVGCCGGYWHHKTIGNEKLWYIEGLISKGYPQNKMVKWPVHEIAHEAIIILETLLEKKRKQNKLFSKRLLLPLRYSKRQGKLDYVYATSFSRLLNRFYEDHGLEVIKNSKWSNHSVHPFRKTYAIFMTDVSGMSFGMLQTQLKHLSIEMTFHYGDPTLTEELETAASERTIRIIKELLNEKFRIAGVGAKRIKKIP